MQNDTDFAEALQDHADAPLLSPDRYNARDYTYCHWSKTVIGLDPNSEKWVVCGVTCKRWGCPYCANAKIRRLAWMSRNAEPTRLVTLTHSSEIWPTPEDCWQASSKAYPELIRFARKRWGEVEYLRVLEVQSNGMPHFHCMWRSAFIPQKPLHSEWNRLCGKAGVNVRKIDSTFRTFHYLVKYLTKLHKIEFTDRHVSYSAKFFRDEDKEKVVYAKLDAIEQIDEHPWLYMQSRYITEAVKVLGDSRWELPGDPREPIYKIDPRCVGLPAVATDAKPQTPLKQRLVPGVQEADLLPGEFAEISESGKRRTRNRRSFDPAKAPVPEINLVKKLIGDDGVTDPMDRPF